ncbi:MAG: DUF4129 domain-containing protein [Actinomycetia bacterium]|nr:DUF4129 domain-containing protein [Actinomycetes bacterium]
MTAFPRPNPAANEASELTPQPLIDDTIDDQAGYRLDPTGQLRPVTADQIQPGDLVVQPVDGGIDIVRADRGRTEIRPEGTTGSSNEAGDEFAVTEIGADGVSRIHQPDANGQVHLDDGVTVQMPTPRPSLGIWERVTTTPWRWIVLGFVLLALSSIGVALYLHFNRPEPFGPGFVGQDGVPVNRFDEFLAMLAADPDPARAIRLAFAAAERGLGSLPARHETETPFEWSARVTTDHAELDHPLSNLCSQFATARFAPHRPSSADRDLAVDELRLLADLADYSPDHTRSTSTDPLVVGS